MYERVNGRDLLRRDVLDLLEEAKADSGWVVSSSEQIPGKNSAGDWWQVNYDGRSGWLYALLVTAMNASGVEVVAAPRR